MKKLLLNQGKYLLHQSKTNLKLNQLLLNNYKPIHSRWIRNILLILFFAKVYQHQPVRCDYDINDMIATIELQQSEMVVEEEEKKKEQYRREQEEKQKQTVKNDEQQIVVSEQKQMLKQKGNEQRYGTQEQMLKQQMDSSEEFGSVEQMMFIKQIEQRKHQEHQADNNINIPQQKQLSSTSENPLVELLIEQVIENQQRALKQQQNLASQQEEPEHKEEQQALQTKAATESAQAITQVPVHQKRQNHGTITFTSDEYLPLAKRLENFLGLRGVKVTLSALKTDQSQSRQGVQLNLCNKVMDCKQMQIKQQTADNKDNFHHLNNFLHPPHIIDSLSQAKQFLQILQKDETLITTYIPQHLPQNNQSNPYDTFSSRYPQPDSFTAQKQFREYKYLSSSKKNCFAIVKDKQAAEYLKMSTSKIGVPHILYRYDKELNGRQSEPNSQIEGEFYHVVQNFDKLSVKQGLDTTAKAARRLNQLASRDFTLINSPEDMYDKIRQLNQHAISFSFQSGTTTTHQQSPIEIKKLFMIKLNDSKAEKEINLILEKLSKMNKKEVAIVKTQSEGLLKTLGVVTNQEYATMRVFDLGRRQEAIIKSQQTYYGHFLRYLPKIPFHLQSLSKWLTNITPYDKPHQQHDHSVNNLTASHPGDFVPTIQIGKMKLVLFYKDGCKGCKLMEDLLSRIVELKQRLRDGDGEAVRRMRREICLRYRIEDPQHIRGIEISKFNILNDDTSLQVPQTTPTIYLFDSKNNQKVILKTQQIFNHLNKINTNNSQIVQDYMLRDLIDEIERGCRRFQDVC